MSRNITLDILIWVNDESMVLEIPSSTHKILNYNVKQFLRISAWENLKIEGFEVKQIGGISLILNSD